ncbi:hypothetical protein GP475_09815 [Corynebacterium poyangense]|uniref:Uncharacterized protein n=1 Tax=Corynebacterium poyangense TaxID=2684405 RepID=A0A7H0SQS6_9CORY|nr:hypothetical protein [Corynebacterium poyangense]MBZ8178220.1 hypothetical protein [Corynebacterium poyangense]QNQ90901.1 hypothetical protein GP475_09815 [Corynebacterium poyangense]
MSQPPQNFSPHPEDSPNWGTYHPQPTSSETISDPQRSPERPGKFTIGDTLSISWNAFKEHWKTLVGAYALFILLLIVLVVVAIIASPSRGATYDQKTDVPFEVGPEFWLAYGIICVLSLAFSIAIVLSSARIIGGQPFAGLRGFFDFHGGGLVFLVNIIASIPGLILFSIVTWVSLNPFVFLLCSLLLILFSLLLVFSVYAAANTPQGVIHALRSSVNVLKKNLGATIGLLVLITLFSIIAGFTLIGVLVVSPYSVLAYTTAYRIAVGAPLKTAYLRN